MQFWHEVLYCLLLIACAGNLWTSWQQKKEVRRLRKKYDKLVTALGAADVMRGRLVEALEDDRTGRVRTDAGKPGGRDTVAGALR